MKAGLKVKLKRKPCFQAKGNKVSAATIKRSAVRVKGPDWPSVFLVTRKVNPQMQEDRTRNSRLIVRLLKWKFRLKRNDGTAAYVSAGALFCQRWKGILLSAV